jgi:predicted PurR-regulated permease PerM
MNQTPFTVQDPVPPQDADRIEQQVEEHLTVHSRALTGLFLLALFYTLHLGRVIFLPMAIALLLAVLFAPLLRRLRQWHIPEPLGAALLLGLFVTGLVFGVLRLAEPAAEWSTKLPVALHTVEYNIQAFKKSMQDVTKATELLSKAAALDEAKKVQQVEVKGDAWPIKVFSLTGDLMIGLATTVILLYFLLSSGDLFLQKLVKVLPSLREKKRAVEIVRNIEEQLFRYLFTVTGINLALGTAVGIAMHVLGMPNPILWGAMAALLTFIPYIGHVFGIIVVMLVAALTFSDLGQMFLIGGVYWALAIVEGSFASPMILGRRLESNPVVLILAVMVWGWIWGVGGALLAVPLLVAFKIMCDHLEPLQPIGEFLGK